jgi:hypothetical protein
MKRGVAIEVAPERRIVRIGGTNVTHALAVLFLSALLCAVFIDQVLFPPARSSRSGEFLQDDFFCRLGVSVGGDG